MTDRSKHSSDIGKTVARDFGDAGVFIGEIVQVDYDSEDIDKVEPIYVVQYTDGDREDMDPEEMQYAHELHPQRLGVDVGNESEASGSNDEESYRPSPKVSLNRRHPYIISILFTDNTYPLEKTIQNQRENVSCE
jgi:hypothetical protein